MSSKKVIVLGKKKKVPKAKSEPIPTPAPEPKPEPKEIKIEELKEPFQELIENNSKLSKTLTSRQYQKQIDKQSLEMVHKFIHALFTLESSQLSQEDKEKALESAEMEFLDGIIANHEIRDDENKN